MRAMFPQRDENAGEALYAISSRRFLKGHLNGPIVRSELSKCYFISSYMHNRVL